MLLGRKGDYCTPLVPADRSRSRLPDFISIPRDEKFDSARALSRHDTVDPAILVEAVELATEYMPYFSCMLGYCG